MPFKSKAQRRKFAELLVKGEISPETFEEWNRETGRQELPERVAAKQRPAGRKRKVVRRKTAKQSPARKKTAATKRSPARKSTRTRTAAKKR